MRLHLCTARQQRPCAHAPPQVSLVDAQQLARTAGALTLLLSGVKPDSDFYVQYHSLQALRAVCAASPPLVQEVCVCFGEERKEIG